MLDARADPNALDYTGAPPLLHVAWRPERPETLTVARLLLEARANPTLEYEQGWSALHVACNKHSGDATQGEQTEAMRELLYRACEEGHPEYLETFDQEKRRDKEANALYRSQAGPAMRIPIEQRRAVLPNGANVESIAQRLVDSHSVVVLSGAGISVSAGIPDFRSPGEGMYAREDTRRAFDAGFVLEQPDKFYAMLKDTFLPSRYGGPRPTLTHAFIKLLSDKKALRRHITQNIDGLDVAAGVPSDLVVEAHGSFAAARCANASCSKPADDMHAFWTTVKDGGVPRCDACASPLRPNVTFFGEALPERYGDLADSDAHNADLLIVLGTSLVVYPFASLVNTVGLLTPRFLINRKPVGPFRDAVGTGMEQGNYRDVAYLGDCDDGVRKLAQLCGWEAQLDEEYKQMLTRLDAEA